MNPSPNSTFTASLNCSGSAKRQRDCDSDSDCDSESESDCKSQESTGSTTNTMEEPIENDMVPKTPLGNTQLFSAQNSCVTQERVLKLLLDVKTGIHPFTVFRGWNDTSMWRTILDRLTLYGDDPPELSLVLQTVLDCHQTYITAPLKLNACVRSLAQIVFERHIWDFDIQIIKKMVSGCNQVGGSKRKKTCADAGTSAVTNSHGICVGGQELEMNHYLHDSRFLSEHRIVDKALTFALQSQRQAELKSNGVTREIGEILTTLVELELIGYDQVVAASKILESSTMAASLLLSAKDVFAQACYVKKIVEHLAS